MGDAPFPRLPGTPLPGRGLAVDELELGSLMGAFGVRGEVRVWLHHPESDLLATPREVVLVAPDGSRRRARGSDCSVRSTVSRMISNIASPSASFSGTPIRSSSGSATISPLSSIAMATEITPANERRRRSATVRACASTSRRPSL